MNVNHSIQSSLTHNGLSCEAEAAARMHYTEIITYLTGLSKHPGLQVSFDFRMSVSPAPFSVTDDISEISVVHEEEQAEEHAEVLANIERARKEDMEAVEARHKREMAKVRAELDAKVAAAADDIYRTMRSDLEEMRAENKALCRERDEANLEVAAAQKELSGWCERCVAAQNAAETLRKELQTEVDGATRVFNAMESDIERLRAENKALERRVAEESHWCKDANMALRTAEMHAQMLRTELAMLQKENEAVEARHQREMAAASKELAEALKALSKGGAKGSSVKLEPELAPKFPEVVRASPQLLAALQAEKTWNDGKDVCYALTKKDYEDMIKAQAKAQAKAQGPLPSVEVVEDHVDLDLLQKMVGAPLSAPPSPLVEEEVEMPDQLAACGAPGCPPAEAKPKPNYNHHFWPSPTTKRFAKHLAKHGWTKDPKTIKSHEDALEYLAEKAKLSVDDLLKMSIKSYQTAHEPWSLPGDPWSSPNSQQFHLN